MRRVAFALALVACSKAENNPTGATAAQSATAASSPAPSIVLTGKPPTYAAGKNFSLEATLPVCAPGAPGGGLCTLTLRLTALGDYHINKEYPFKLTANAAPGMTFLGKGEPNTFSRASGDLKEEGEKVATMTIRYRPPTSGEANITGTYKMSVCSAENCQLEQVGVQLAVPLL